MSGNEARGRIIVDARGTFCPTPIVKISEAIQNVDAGVIVELISDDSAIEFDLPAWCKSAGHTIISTVKDGAVFTYLVLKSEGKKGS